MGRKKKEERAHKGRLREVYVGAQHYNRYSHVLEVIVVRSSIVCGWSPNAVGANLTRNSAASHRLPYAMVGVEVEPWYTRDAVWYLRKTLITSLATCNMHHGNIMLDDGQC